MNCYMCDGAGRTVAAVAICHHCGAALCRDHLDEDLLAPRPRGHVRHGCNHNLHKMAMERRAAVTRRSA